MKILFRAAAVLFAAIAAVLLYSVVAAIGSTEGARMGVVVGYIVASAVLGYGAFALWRAAGRRSKVSAASAA